ncbi:MAG TPA: alkaline phosphatase D family protein [Ferruginibacter sp.]|nr:alkaline phosphatase D family protein [Ferruginibacter sp.]
MPIFKRIHLLAVFIFFFYPINLFAQKPSLISGPWAGNVELRNATIWAEVSPSVRTVAVKYSRGDSKIKTVFYKGPLHNEFNPVKIELNNLEINSVYTYTLVLDGNEIKTSFPTRFITKDLWEWRKPAPDFTFLAGSCSYFNEPVYDRPGKPYGGDSSIFETMAGIPAAFHIWMGDNWYTREVDFYSTWGMTYRASRDRSQKVIQRLMSSMPQYAIWDDHDYGPNDIGKNFILKDESRNIFKNYTLNPGYGEEGKGIYTKISYSDADIFLTDDRFFRSDDNMPDSINGKPSTSKTFFGQMQMDWLKNSLMYSKATFKIIVVGSQVINPLGTTECMRRYSFEYNDLINFISAQNISGILFFSGDRHHSEVMKVERPGAYSLYDITISPYTAGISRPSAAEANHPNRIINTLVEQQNFGTISITGKKNERKLRVQFLGLKGQLLGEWSITENELRNGLK